LFKFNINSKKIYDNKKASIKENFGISTEIRDLYIKKELIKKRFYLQTNAYTKKE